MKRYSAILFDLDGTLLPYDDMHGFLQTYFSLLYTKGPEFGYEEEVFHQAFSEGMRAMRFNDGAETNQKRFWDAFTAFTGRDNSREIEARLAEYYTGPEYRRLKALTGENPLVGEVMAAARQVTDRIVIATNPVYPLCALTERMHWVGLSENDVDYVSCYENSHFCKPTREYYDEMFAAVGADPSRGIMIGNDLREDIGALKTGAELFIVDSWLLDRGEDVNQYLHGDTRAMIDYILRP